jgi:hypothetical protein
MRTYEKTSSSRIELEYPLETFKWCITNYAKRNEKKTMKVGRIELPKPK